MKKFVQLLLVIAAAVTPIIGFAQSSAKPTPKKVLFFSKSSGFEHDAIKEKMKDGKPGYAFPVMSKLGEDDAIEFTFSKDGSKFTPDYLAQFDAFVFYTTGDLNVSKVSNPSAPIFTGDGNPGFPAGGKEALLKAIESGKGFVGIHSASDSFHTHAKSEHGPERFVSDGDKADDYVKMLGGEFIQHGKQQISHLTIVDRSFPGISAYPESPAIHEEWYSLKNFAPDLHVLIVNQTKDMEGIEYARPDYPSTWIRLHGKGRVFYTNMGHRDDLWQSAAFQSLLTGALNWTLKRVDADTTPNLKTAAPEASTLPKYVAPPPKKST
jgi:type 1 glutamine amidotransferase